MEVGQSSRFPSRCTPNLKHRTKVRWASRPGFVEHPGWIAMLKSPNHIYIVDDEPTICTAFARLMRSQRMEAQSFASVEDFLHSDLCDDQACVICDVQMPGGDGFELPSLLAQAGYHMPVIFITAHDTPESRELAQRVGAAAYFRKPVDDQALLDAIAWALSGNPKPSEKPLPGDNN